LVQKLQATPPPAVEEGQIRKLFELLDGKSKGEVAPVRFEAKTETHPVIFGDWKVTNKLRIGQFCDVSNESCDVLNPLKKINLWFSYHLVLTNRSAATSPCSRWVQISFGTASGLTA